MSSNLSRCHILVQQLVRLHAIKDAVSETACIQIPWPHAKPPYRGAPSQTQPNPHAHPSLPAGAQVTPTASRAQQPPQLAAQASMEMNMQALQVKHEVAIVTIINYDSLVLLLLLLNLIQS